MSIENAVKVNSIREEYEYIAAQRCPCGGPYARQGQALHFDDDQVPHDRITVQCTSCGTTAEYWFNCSAFFGKPFWEEKT